MDRDALIARAKKDQTEKMRAHAERLKANLVGTLDIDFDMQTGYAMMQVAPYGRLGLSFYDFLHTEPEQIAEKLRATPLGTLDLVPDSQKQVGPGGAEEEDDAVAGRNKVWID